VQFPEGDIWTGRAPFRTGGPKLLISMPPAVAVCQSCNDRAFVCFPTSAAVYEEQHTTRNKHWGRLAWKGPQPVVHKLRADTGKC